MAERFKAHDWKSCVRKHSQVRILSPPLVSLAESSGFEERKLRKDSMRDESCLLRSWWVDRVVYGAGLENQWAQALTGSNPVPTARFFQFFNLLHFRQNESDFGKN